MKVHLYDVVNSDVGGDFLEACRIINDKDIKSRLHVIGGYNMKMEDTEFHEEEGLYYMDFTKHRPAGPGRATKTELTRGFDLKSDEDYGELTATLYDDNAKVLLVQYNHYGYRAGKIAEYIKVAGNGNFEFEIDPRLTRDVLAKLERKRYATKVSCRLKLPPRDMTSSDREQGVSLSSALDLAKKTNIQYFGEIEITLSKVRGKARKMENFKGYIKSILNLHEENEDQVKSIKAHLSETSDDEPEPIDFLHAREEKIFDGLKMNKGTRMYPFDERCKALRSIHKSWLNEGIIERE